MNNSKIMALGLGLLLSSAFLQTDAKAVRLSASFDSSSPAFNQGGRLSVSVGSRPGLSHFTEDRIDIKTNERIPISNDVQINGRDRIFYNIEYEATGKREGHSFTQSGICEQEPSNMQDVIGVRLHFTSLPGKTDPLKDNSPWFRCIVLHSKGTP